MPRYVGQHADPGVRRGVDQLSPRGTASLLGLLIVCTLFGCAAPRVARSPDPAPEQRPAPPKRITAAVLGDAHTVYNKLNLGNGVPGIEAMEELVSAGVANTDGRGDLRPQLAEQVPTTDNGLWRVLPDGRMELTWKVRPGARWHDGVPISAEDFVFTARVMQDPELSPFRDASYALLDAVEEVDHQTVIARWKRPFINADSLFTRKMTLPLPRHILEQSYAENKAGFLDLPYWNQEFVGSGPFKLRELVRGSHLTLDANDRYVLGRPNIDVVEIRFIPDPATLAANILAGEVELTLHRTLSLEAAIDVRDRWRDGRIEVSPSSLYRLWPQLADPSPAVIGDVRFRRALLHGIDRQQIVDTLQGGISAVAETVLPPNRPEYVELEAGAMRYEFDQQRAARMIEELGLTRARDGTFRDASNQELGVEIRSSGGGTLEQPVILTTVDYWQRIGVRAEPFFIPPQRNQDREYRAKRPGFLLRAGLSDIRGITS
jgi:peptide/nickel transport system substrate-binding protein